jgi:hypothetical protein
MIEFKRNKHGVLEAYKDGKKIGAVNTMGDEVKKEKENGGVQSGNKRRQHR